MKILKWFGLTTLSSLNDIENKFNEVDTRNKEYQKLISDLTKVISEYDEIPKPSVEYADYKKDERNNRYNKEIFYEWYSIYLSNQYAAFKLRRLSKHPHLLKAFMVAIGTFNWESVRLHMEETKWCWNDKTVSPTIDELIDCVITLIPENGFDSPNGVSSGGFTVKLYYENEKPICNITFNATLKYY